MKKIALFLLVVLLGCGNVYSQTKKKTVKHNSTSIAAKQKAEAESKARTSMSVLGINLDTTIKKFNAELSKKGIKPTQTGYGNYTYIVKYAGYSNCSMEVKYNLGNDSVLTVTIDFPHESIAKDKTIFENIAGQFKEKYGKEFKLGEELDQIKEEYLGYKTKRTRYERYYGGMYADGNFFYGVSWFLDDDEYEDGVSVVYRTKARKDKKVSVSPDI